MYNIRSAPAINKGMDQLRGVLGNVSDSVKGLSDNETLAESKKRAAEAAEMLRRGATESEFSKKVQDSTKETLHEARKKAEAVGSEALGEEKYKGVMGFIGREIMFAKEFARAMKPKEKAEKKTRLSVGESIAPKKKGASTSATDEEEEDDDAVRNEEGEVQFMAPMVVGEQKTRWEQRFDSLKETVRGTVYKKARSVKRTVESSENEQVQRVLSAKDNVVDKIEDAREIYETSQHPLVHKAREIEESVAGETDQAVCIREFMDMDAEFRVPAFLEYMEDYMIPVVVDGFRRGDLNLLLGVCEDQSEAARMMYASCRAREVQGHYWDTRMLELTNIDFIKAELNDEVPEVHMSFQCQHVLCTKNSKGEVVEGDESSIKQVFYHWILIRDFESEHFDWKITSFQCQEIHSLAA